MSTNEIKTRSAEQAKTANSDTFCGCNKEGHKKYDILRK